MSVTQNPVYRPFLFPPPVDPTQVYGLTDGAGGSMQHVVMHEVLTLSTSGATTDSTANLLPANSIILAVCTDVTVTITTATNWAVGDGTTAARFSAANSTKTATTSQVGMQHLQGGISTDAAGPVQAAAAKVRITVTGSNPGAGAVSVTVYALVFSPPNS